MPDKNYSAQFKQWFEDMQERYQAYYGGYEELLQEAFEAGAKQEREACLKICEAQAQTNYWEGADVCAEAIRARGQT